MKAEFPKYNNVKHETLYTTKFYAVKGGPPQLDLHPYPRGGRALKTEATGICFVQLSTSAKSTSAYRDDSATEESQSIQTALINDQSQSQQVK